MEKKQPRGKSRKPVAELQRREELRPDRERKDRVLQARVSQSLYKDLVEQARRLRVPVSNLVRNILEDSTRMVENIVDSSLEIADVLRGKTTEEDLSSVLGWQPMIVHRKLSCSHCGTSLQKGGQAFMSVGLPGGRTVVICEGCKSSM
jgi:hypothetical protein